MKPDDFNPIEILNNRLVKAHPHRFYWHYEDRKVHIQRKDITRDGPWIWPFKSGTRNCMLYHHIMFKCLNILPYPCLGCWKMVVTIPNIRMLYKMYEFMSRWDHTDCKLGIEVRYYTPRNYGAYFYHRTKREGLATLRKFRETEIATSGNLTAKLKRGCTEFEIRFGASDKWDDLIGLNEMQQQDQLMALIECPKKIQEQEVYQRQLTSRLWQTFSAEVEMESVTYENDDERT
ncbi:MAG: hypothetical protein GY820_16970 [Gammaproteobacteria bacterium]|nr:hypothetical protein [Gammaproteobacteria bacterium]